MSIWIEEYEKVLNKLEEIKEEIDQIDCNHNDDCLRMKKVFNINYKILKNLDPELLSLRSIYQLIYTQKALYGSTLNFSGHLLQLLNFVKNKNFNKANDILDNVFNIIKPYILHRKRLGDPLAESVKIYKNEIEKHLIELKEIENEEEKIKEVIEKIYKYENELFVDDEEKKSIKTKIETIVNDIEDKKEKIYNFYNKLFEGDNNNNSIEISIDKLFNDIKVIKSRSQELEEEIEKILSNTQNTIRELKRFYDEIFGEKNEETGEREGGLKNEIERRKKELDNLKQEYEQFKEIQKTKYQALYDEIEDLLPGAVSAGLAKAYQEKRERFEEQTKFWSEVFIFALVMLFIGGCVIVWNFEKINTLKDTFLHLLKYLPLYGPAIWLAFYNVPRRRDRIDMLKYIQNERKIKI